ncbi:MAG: sialidase family protein, partial [Phycisphaerae bacterium]
MRDDEVRVRIMIIALAIVAALVTDGARADGPAADPQRTPSVKPVTSAPHPTAKAVPVRGRLPETPNNPPAPAEVLSRRATEPARTWARGPFVSVQVNVNAMGNNIIGDAANEPSIAIDPTDPSKIAIGWRQFDTIASDFRQAGVAYSQDDGQTWTFPGVLDPGQFRSDPVLGADADGNFYYYSLSTVTTAEVFKSTDGGATWAAPVNGWGGDKEWMTVDRTSSIGQNNIYAIWNVQFSCCGNTDFTRSINQGLSFQSPIKVPEPSMKWGTLDVGPDGTLYLAGATLDQSGHVFARSVNAKNTAQTPVFDLVTSISLGGTTSFGNPNPDGLLGQVNIATDHSAGPSSGNVYVLASVNPPNADP